MRPVMDKAIEKHIERRSLLKGTALATVATTLPTLPALSVVSGNDRALIEAEAEITRLYTLPILKDENNDCFDEPWASIYAEVYRLEDFIAATPPQTLAGVAVKLRRVLDREVGMDPTASTTDLPSLLSVLSFIHGVIGKPSHPTRPTYVVGDLT
jgi:hypothetical protein